MPLTVLATLPLPAQHEAELRELNAEVSTLQFDGIIENELPSWNAAMITSAAFRLPDSGAALYEQLADLVRRGRVEWVHFCAAGMDGQMFIPLIRAAHAAGIKMTYCPGVYATPIAQYVIAHVLSCTRMLREHAEQQASKTWAPLMQRDPRGAVVGVVGAGGIGNEVARMATALGMRSIGWRRRAGSFGSFEDIFTGEEGLDALLMESDFVVVAVPNTPQTRNLINTEKLALMKPSAWIINVARGAVIDEIALTTALQIESAPPAGAVLDVAAVEPLALDSPLWSMQNVVITPHDSWMTQRAAKDNTAYFVDNLRRLQRGEALREPVPAEYIDPVIESNPH